MADTDALTPFCRGFLQYCSEREFSPEQVAQLIEKSAAFDPAVRDEWAPLMKQGGKLGDLLRRGAAAAGERLGVIGKETAERVSGRAAGEALGAGARSGAGSGGIFGRMGNWFGRGRPARVAPELSGGVVDVGVGSPGAGSAFGQAAAPSRWHYLTRPAKATAVTVGGAAGFGAGMQAYDRWTNGHGGIPGVPPGVVEWTKTPEGQELIKRLEGLSPDEINAELNPAHIARRLMAQTFEPRVTIPTVPSVPVGGIPGGMIPPVFGFSPPVSIVDTKLRDANMGELMKDKRVQAAIEGYVDTPEGRKHMSQFAPQNPLAGGIQGILEWIQQNPGRAAALGIGIPLALRGLFSGGGGGDREDRGIGWGWALPAGLGLAGAAAFWPQLQELYRNAVARREQGGRPSATGVPIVPDVPEFEPPAREIEQPRSRFAQWWSGQPAGQPVV